MEQRIRRTISKAMNAVANLGIEDLNNDIYVEYSSSLFEIKQVKQEMQHLKCLSVEQGKLNTKKFIEGILVKDATSKMKLKATENYKKHRSLKIH